ANGNGPHDQTEAGGRFTGLSRRRANVSRLDSYRHRVDGIWVSGSALWDLRRRSQYAPACVRQPAPRVLSVARVGAYRGRCNSESAVRLTLHAPGSRVGSRSIRATFALQTGANCGVVPGAARGRDDDLDDPRRRVAAGRAARATGEPLTGKIGAHDE